MPNSVTQSLVNPEIHRNGSKEDTKNHVASLLSKKKSKNASITTLGNTPVMFDALSPDSPWSGSNLHNRLTARGSNQSDEPSVLMVVNDPSLVDGLRLYGSREPIPGATIDGHVNVYALEDSADGLGVSGQPSMDESKETEQSDGPKQHSIVTIFSVWNTMMGTSILAMPWTLQQAGFGFGIFLIILVAAIACYTAYLALRSTEDIRIIQGTSSAVFMDISDACYFHFGKAGRIVALVFSLISLLGASIVYYVLLTNFLYYTGEYIYQSVTQQFPTPPVIEGNTRNITNILCPLYSAPTNVSNTTTSDLYHKLWVADRTVPAWLLILLIPLVSIKSPTCLGKFTTLATVSVVYLFVLLGLKGYGWGVNMTMPPLIEPVLHYRNYFAALTGTCSMAFYIHNALHTIMRAQKKPENNVRDVAIAFTFATITYMLMGTVFFVVFPVSKLCILDNFLNNLVTDVPVFIGRLALLFQMSMVYPMIVYILRAQVMYAICGNVYPNWYSVFGLHLLIIGAGLLFAIVYPSIGTIIRFIGALCGLVYIFTIPTVLTLINKWILGHRRQTSSDYASPGVEQDVSLLKEGVEKSRSSEWIDAKTKRRWYIRCACYSVLILFGLGNFIAQFVLLGLE